MKQLKNPPSFKIAQLLSFCYIPSFKMPMSKVVCVFPSTQSAISYNVLAEEPFGRERLWLSITITIHCGMANELRSLAHLLFSHTAKLVSCSLLCHHCILVVVVLVVVECVLLGRKQKSRRTTMWEAATAAISRLSTD